MRIVSVVNQKGGAGKSTTVMNLAAIAAQSSRVLVVDVDPQQSVTMWATHTEKKLPADRQLPFDTTTETDPEVLSKLRNTSYDIIFVDTPGNLENTEVIRTVVENSDFVILPTEPTTLALVPLVNTYKLIVEPAGVPYLIVITKVDSRAPADAEGAQKLLRDDGLAVANAFIRSYKIHERAPIDGEVVTTYEKTRNAQKATIDFKDVALELFNIWAKKGN